MPVKKQVLVTGDQFVGAQATFDNDQRPAVSVDLNEAAGRVMRQATRENLKHLMAIILIEKGKGEAISVAVMSQALKRAGIPATGLTATQARIYSDGVHLEESLKNGGVRCVSDGDKDPVDRPVCHGAGLEIAHLDLGERARAARGGRLHVDIEDHVRLAVDLNAEVALEITGGDHRAGLPRDARQLKRALAPAGADRVGRSPWPTPS